METSIATTATAVTVKGAKKIRVTSAIPNWLQVGELQAVQAKTGINVALASSGATAVGSGNYDPRSTPDKAINGILPAKYPDIYHSNGRGADEFLEITLAVPTDLASLTIYGRIDYPSRDSYKITIFNTEGATLFSGQLDNTALKGGGNTLTFPDVENEPIPSPTYTLGVNKSLGGTVIFVAPDGKSGLVAAMQDQGEKNDWYRVKEGINKPENHDADGQKFTDWRMPTLDELHLMYVSREAIGGFENGVHTNKDYWSSTEFAGISPSLCAYYLRISTGFGGYSNMSFGKFYARAVRAF